MCNKLSLGSVRASGGLDVRLPRTTALLLGVLVVVATWLPPPVSAEVEIDVLGEVVEGERVGVGRELEASMHSSLLRDFQEVTEGVRNTPPPTAFPDSSAVVGRIFQMKVPNKMEDVYLGDIVKVSLFLCFLTVTTLFIPEEERRPLVVHDDLGPLPHQQTVSSCWLML